MTSPQQPSSPPTKWPPPTIAAWLHGMTINSEHLADELRRWSDYFYEGGES